MKSPTARGARAELCLAYESHSFPAESYEETVRKQDPSRGQVTAWCSKHREMGTCPVVMAWGCFSGLNVLSSGKFSEKFSHGYPFGFSFLIIKLMFCTETF